MRREWLTFPTGPTGSRSAIVAIAATVLVALVWESGCGSQKASGFSTGPTTGPVASAENDSGGTQFLFGNDAGGFDGSLGIGTGTGGDASSGAGPAGCDPSCAAAGGTCAAGACSVSENPGNVSTAVQMQLQGKGSADTAFAWLYPYDKTVFPRGLLSPTLQFGGGASDAEYVHITSKTLDYKGFFAGGGAGKVSLSLSQKAWAAVTEFVGTGDSASVAVTKISGGNVTGPITETWPIAQGSLRGAIFYETYGSQIAGGANSVAIMKILPGAAQPTALKTGCGNVCHTASADGTTLVAATSVGASASYDVRSNISTLATANSTIFTYAGIFPDGTFAMSATGFRTSLNLNSRLYDTKTGNSIAATGWDSTITLAGTPAFSPDGKQIAFMHQDKNAYTIAKMDFDASTKTFSGLVDLASNSSSEYVAWPAFTPDGKTVIYHSGSSTTYETDCQATGDIYAVDVASKMLHRLDTLDGYTGASGSYLPAKDTALNFAPTVLAEAVGGYFWAVFTSHRSYGNLMASKANSSGFGGGMCLNPQGDEADGKLWVAAIDIGAQPGRDISHPAFYLDGQELQADNLRGYWVLPACQANGSSCQTGDECCCGFCRSSGSAAPTCVCKPPGCSNEFETCVTAADCCNKSDQCINGRCAMPAPQ
jgi:hypothetical protein